MDNLPKSKPITLYGRLEAHNTWKDSLAEGVRGRYLGNKEFPRELWSSPIKLQDRRLVISKDARIIFGNQHRAPVKIKPYVPQRPDDYKFHPNKIIIKKGRMTANSFNQDNPKPNNPAIIESKWKTYYGNVQKLRFDNCKPLQGKKYIRPGTSSMIRDNEITAKRIRVSTPQIDIGKRPESRYNKATLSMVLNNGRDISPGYHVPVIPMRLSENFGEHMVYPSCWK